MNLSSIANKTILPPESSNRFIKKGVTKDIVREIFNHDKDAFKDVKEFSKYLEANTVEKTASNIWNFLKDEITYKEDPENKQFIQYPRRLIHNKKGDCKSLSIFTGAVLKNLNIPYFYRFTNYVDPVTGIAPNDIKHVYTIIPLNGEEIIVDVVHSSFNQEKPYNKKIDIMPTTEIYSLGALPNDNIQTMSKADFIIKLVIDRMRAEAKASKSKGKIYKAKGFLKQAEFLQEVKKVVDSNLSKSDKIKTLNQLRKGKKLDYIFDKIIKNLGVPLAPFYSSLNELEKENYNKLIFEFLPKEATKYIDVLADKTDFQKYANPIQYAQREEKIKDLNLFAKLLDLNSTELFYYLKTSIIDQFGLTPEMIYREYNKRSDTPKIGEPVTATVLTAIAAYKAGKAAYPVVKDALVVAKDLGGQAKDFLGGLFGKKKSSNESSNELTYYQEGLKHYADVNHDLKQAFGYDLEKLQNHFETTGINENRKGRPDGLPTLDFAKLDVYGQQNPDVLQYSIKQVQEGKGGNKYGWMARHWFAYGQHEGRLPNLNVAEPIQALTFKDIANLADSGQLPENIKSLVKRYYLQETTSEENSNLMNWLYERNISIPPRDSSPKDINDLLNSSLGGKNKKWC